MTCQYVTHGPCACAHVLLWMLVASSTTWRPSCAFDFLNGHDLNTGKANSKHMDIHRLASESWQPSTLWWRSRRSASHAYPHPPLPMAVSLSSLPVFIESSQFPKERFTSRYKADNEVLIPQDNEVWSSLDEDVDDHSKALDWRKFALESAEDDLELPSMAGQSKDLSKLPKPVYSPGKLMVKMKLLEGIREALRRRSKIEAAERERERERLETMRSPIFAHKAAHKLKHMHDLDEEKEALFRQQKTIKSRRAKMGLLADHGRLGKSLLPVLGTSPFAASDNDRLEMSADRRFHAQGLPTAHKVPSQTFPEVEWFADPSEERPPQSSSPFTEFAMPYSKDNGFHTQSAGTFGSPSSSDSWPLFPEAGSLSGGFSDVPVSDFNDAPMKDGTLMQPGSFASSFHSGPDPPRPAKQEDETIVGMWEVGFQDDNKDCDTISTKTCSSDADCSCYGFYVCAQGRCDIKTNMKSPSRDTWHDEPIDFGFTKRQADDHKMAADMDDSEDHLKH